MKNYVIFAPPYSKSNGVRTLYSLSLALEKKGYNAPVLTISPHENFHCITDFTKEMQKNDIIIYPETISGNPLKFSHVARYILYFPGKLGGDKSFPSSEFIFTWDKCYFPNVPELRFPGIDRSLFFDAALPKTQDCVFVYKNGRWKKIPELEHLTTITMDYPKTRRELAHLLQTTGTLYSYDEHSMINDEAFICGAHVKIITETGLKEYTFEDNFDYLRHDEQLSTLIDISQKIPKTSPIPNKLNIKLVLQYIKLINYKLLASIFKNTEIAFRFKKYRWKLGMPCDKI